jgi:hypothetical protein
MIRNKTLHCQKIAAAALEKEFGFAPAKLNKIELVIVLPEIDKTDFYIRFRIGEHYYTCSHGKIERTDDRGVAL